MPSCGRKWLAENAWRFAVIAIILCVVGILSIVGVAMAFSAAANSMHLQVGLDVANHAGLFGAANIMFFAAMIYMVMPLVVYIVLLSFAVSRLKSYKKSGWNLVLAVICLNFAVAFAMAFLKFDSAGVVVAFLWAAVGSYIMFEIRDSFIRKKSK